MANQGSGFNVATVVARIWPVYAIVLIFIGGATFHFFDTVVFERTVRRLVFGVPLYLDPASSYFPPVWYVLAIPVMIARSLGLPGFYLFPWILSTLSVIALSITGIYGARHLDPDLKRMFILAVLLNPLTLIGIIIWSQSDALVVLGVVPAIVGFSTGRYRLFGIGTMWGAIIKIAPVFMLVPGLVIARKHRREILIGSLVVIVPTLLTTVMHDGIQLMFDPSHGLGYRTLHSRVWFTNPLAYLKITGGGESLALSRAITAIGVIVGVAWSLLSKAPDELRLVGPMAAAILLYPASYPYRWLPIALAALWIGYRYREKPFGRAIQFSGWILSITGGAILVLSMIDVSSGVSREILGTPGVFSTEDLLTPVANSETVHLAMWALAMVNLLVFLYAVARTEYLSRVS